MVERGAETANVVALAQENKTIDKPFFINEDTPS
jgi:hypothetical protein